MAYCTLDDVKSLTHPDPTYNSETTPTEAQVEEFVDMVGDDISLTAISAGYQLPINDAKAASKLRLVNMWGAAALAEQANDSQDTEVSENATDWWNKYQSALRDIRGIPGILGEQTKVAGRPRSMWTTHAADGSDDNISDITPWFRRDDYY